MAPRRRRWLEKRQRFAAKFVTKWLGVTTKDEDFISCDGSGDGGIDVDYLQRTASDSGNQDDDPIEGDT